MSSLYTGCSAYFDSFAGLVPVKVLSVKAPDTPPLFDLGHGKTRVSIRVRAQVTKDLKPYKKGEIVESDSVHIVPRGALRQTEYSTVVGVYDVVPDKTEEAACA